MIMTSPPGQISAIMFVLQFFQKIWHDIIWFTTVASIEGGWGPYLKQDFQNNINFIGFIDSIFDRYMHIEL